MKLHSSQVLLLALVAFLVGIFVSAFLHPAVTRGFEILGLIIAVITVTVFFRNRTATVIALALFSIVFGVFRYQQSLPVIDSTHIAYFNDSDIQWEGLVIEEPDIRSDKVYLTMKAQKILSPQTREIGGMVLLTVPRYPEYGYGEVLRVSGKIQTPFETEDFSYKDYLAKDNIFSTARFVQVQRISGNKGNIVKANLLAFKQYFSSKVSEVVSDPASALLLGLLVGERRGLPNDLLDNFRSVGVTHIIAISGFNISIITRMLGVFLQKKLGIRAAFFLIVLVVFGFVVITGAQASVVRAAIMGVLVVAAMNLGRMSRMGPALVLTAAVMVFLNPKILSFDVGFQLSFLATAGLLFFADRFEKFFSRIPEFFQLRTTLSATLAAQVAVLPLLIYYFSQISLISPLANLLILPVIPWAMLFGFLTGIGAMIYLPLAYIPAWIAWLLLEYIIVVPEFLSRVPFASVAVEKLSISWVWGYYILLVLLAWKISKKQLLQKISDFRNFQPPV